ncbi:hypothetical protein PMAYCL1PPCAC_33158, partial [Pristionchus mayeri]
FLLCITGVHCFVYTCNEVKGLITSKTSIAATNACVSLDEFISLRTGFATEVFIQDGTGENKWSLADIYKVGCVNSTVSWSIVADREDQGAGIDCDNYPFTVMFASIQSTIITAKNSGHYHYSDTAGNITVVDPRGGILIDFDCDNKQQRLDFYSGLGEGEDEEMFYMGTAECHDRFTLWALDTVVTISIPEDGHIKMTPYGTGGYLSIGATAYDMVIMGSGKSSNLIQHGEDDKFLWLDSDFGVTFHIDGFYEMDPKVGNFIVFTALCQNNPCTTKAIPLNSSDVHLSIDADLLSFDYYTKVNQSSYWRDEDSFFFRVISTPLVTEAPPTTPFMPAKPNTTYSCGCGLTNGVTSFSSSLWLDIIFVVDVSQSMDASTLQQASSLIESIMTSLTLDSNSENRKYSRVGLIAASDHAEIIFDLSSPFNNSLDLGQTSAVEADIGKGISAAMDMFSQASTRSARQLIYVIAASNSSSTSFSINFSQSKILTSSVADPFKESGGIIAVTEVDVLGSVSSLQRLSSPGYYNLGLSTNVNLDLQMLCDEPIASVLHLNQDSAMNLMREEHPAMAATSLNPPSLCSLMQDPTVPPLVLYYQLYMMMRRRISSLELPLNSEPRCLSGSGINTTGKSGNGWIHLILLTPNGRRVSQERASAHTQFKPLDSTVPGIPPIVGVTTSSCARKRPVQSPNSVI